MTTGQRIKEVRKKAGKTQVELGRLLGVSGSMIAQYEADKRNPKQETIRRIADALQCDFYWLLWGEKLTAREKIVMDTIRLFCIQDEHDQRIVDVVTKRMEYELNAKGYSFSETEQRMITAFSQMDNSGREKVIDYAEDILPRYRTVPQSSPPPQEGIDTTLPQNAPETPPEGGENK